MKQIVLIAGSSHTGKTALAQKVLERYGYPYLSIDHLKMGLIRSGHCPLTPESDDADLTAYLWPIVREIIKTAIENHQRLVVEGCYIPFGWEKDFSAEYLAHIRYFCLVMSQHYIETHFGDIKAHANAIEQRLDDTGCLMEAVIQDNTYYLDMCQKFHYPYVWIDEGYQINIDL